MFAEEPSASPRRLRKSPGTECGRRESTAVRCPDQSRPYVATTEQFQPKATNTVTMAVAPKKTEQV